MNKTFHTGPRRAALRRPRRPILFALPALLAFALAAAPVVSAQPATLVRDIQPGMETYPLYAEHGDFVRSGASLYLVVEDLEIGSRLWKTDGTTAGTALVSDLRMTTDAPLVDVNGTTFFVAGAGLWKTDGTPAGTVLVRQFPPSQGDPKSLVNVEGTLFFLYDALGPYEGPGPELWKSDGTEQGTILVAPVSVKSPIAFAGRLLFLGSDPDHGEELWTSDGNPAGTHLVADINDGPGGSVINGLTVVGNAVLFGASDGVHPKTLWRTDGTAEGTSVVGDFANGPWSPDRLTAFGGLLLFVGRDAWTGDELWRSDGTPNGTFRLSDVRPGTTDSAISSITSAGAVAYFVADDAIHGSELWRTDGSINGTSLALDVRPGPAGSSPDRLVAIGANLFFTAFDASGRRVLFRSDGTWEGTSPLLAVNVFSPIAFGARLVFWGNSLQLTDPQSLWTTDGTSAGTGVFFRFLRPFGSIPSSFAAVGGDVYFRTRQGTDGPQIWKTDGTGAGTVQLTAFAYDSLSPIGGPVNVSGHVVFSRGETLWSLTPGDPTPQRLSPDARPAGVGDGINQIFDSRLYFPLYSDLPSPNRELWATDGTAAGTFRVRAYGNADIFFPLVPFSGFAYFFIGTYPNGGYALWRTDGTELGTTSVRALPPPWTPGHLTAAGPFLIFRVGDAIWRSDGTESGTVQIVSFGGSSFTPALGKVFFVADQPGTGSELWVTDGTPGGTLLVKDIQPGPIGSSPSGLTALGGFVYFAADDGTHGSELWRSDGTESGTKLVADIAPGLPGSGISQMTLSNGQLRFTASDLSFGRELWRSDGTQEGTSRVLDISAGSAGSDPDSLTDVAGTLYFAASDPVAGIEPWRSDGTPGGTVRIRDLYAPLASSLPSSLVEFRGRLAFTANTDANGRELWESDGTSTGTRLIVDLAPGPAAASPTFLTPWGGQLMFSAQDLLLGNEPFIGDGTPGGTHLLKDIYAGNDPSSPYGLRVLNDRVFFAANDGGHGSEPWITDGTVNGTTLLKDIFPGSGSASVSGTASAGGLLYFTARDSSAGWWRTDGTVAGTMKLAPFGGAVAALGNVGCLLTTAGGQIELWKSDGTPGGTSRVAAIPPVMPSPHVGEIATSGSRLFFTANDELWASDGTPAGTIRLHEPFLSAPRRLTGVNGMLFFAADDGSGTGEELWKSDGTPGGTALVKDILPGPLSSTIGSLTDVGGVLMFGANDGIHGDELWKSDGTPEGTQLFQDIDLGIASSHPGRSPNDPQGVGAMAIAGTRVYFAASDSQTGTELWSMPMSAVCAPPPGPTIISSHNPSCGDAVTLDAGPGYASYLWSTGETTRTIVVSPAVTTTYTAIVANAAGCRSSSTIVQAVDPALVPLPPPVSNNGPICAGETLQLSAGTVAGAAYFWTGPDAFTSTAQNPEIFSAAASASGVYQVVIRVSGCPSPPASTTAVVHSLPSAQIAASSGVCANSASNPASVADAGPGATYVWSIENGTITSGAGTRAILFTAPASGTISLGVTVTDANGCTRQDNRSISVGETCGMNYFTLAPCRLVDTRGPDGPQLGPYEERTFQLGGNCGIPPEARAVALNVAVTMNNQDGNLTLYPEGELPNTSSINYPSGRSRSNNATVGLDPSGRVKVKCNQGGGSTHVILDVYGYYAQ